ncbi:unnamed protein product [Rhizoctonia solani]|uniref:DUF6535 domain-containing protein n=1 Tax=Rhizoctonia solani TaxID=456999 RepID=A0A8H2ZYZ5_9AGAM|nr:unnamed protein product [Rhizoctonia solani]
MSNPSAQPDIAGSTARPVGIRRHRSIASSKHVPNREMGADTATAANVDQATNATNYDRFDEYGAELGPDARVWKTYVKEADKFDIEQVNGWNSSLDVTLIFAALFTAICTAFVVESSKSLKEDPPERSANRLDQITNILLVIANVNAPSQLNMTEIINPRPFSPRPIDLCVNALWFFALSLSAAVSLIAMLAKEWCQSFMSGRIGDPWLQTKRRQQRWKGIEKWKMEQVVMFLPSLIHLAVLSFAVGLCLYLGDLHFGMAVPAALVTAGSMLVTTIYRLIKAWFNLTKKHISTDESDSERESIAIRALAWLIKTCEEPRQTFQHVSSVEFIPSTHNIEALRIAAGAAPHCLQSLVGEAPPELPEPLEHALDLLEAHCRGEKRVDQEAMDYLVIGAAILLSRSAAERDSGSVARVIMRLLRDTWGYF